MITLWLSSGKIHVSTEGSRKDASRTQGEKRCKAGAPGCASRGREGGLWSLPPPSRPPQAEGRVCVYTRVWVLLVCTGVVFVSVGGRAGLGTWEMDPVPITPVQLQGCSLSPQSTESLLAWFLFFLLFPLAPFFSFFFYFPSLLPHHFNNLVSLIFVSFYNNNNCLQNTP